MKLVANALVVLLCLYVETCHYCICHKSVLYVITLKKN